jgi:hypothetical protein
VNIIANQMNASDRANIHALVDGTERPSSSLKHPSLAPRLGMMAQQAEFETGRVNIHQTTQKLWVES